MAPWESFDQVFAFNKKYSYEPKVYDQILSNRRSLGQLFADRLLSLFGIQGVTKVYPPKNNGDLRALFNHIVPSELDIHHKQSLIYYILKDCRAAPEAPAQFAQQCHLPEKYRLLIEGLWHMDRLDFRRAVEFLAEPSLIPTFPDEILYALTLTKLPKHDNSLAIAYYLTASPPLATTKVRAAFFEALARSNVTEAFYFTRKYDEEHRQELFEQLVEFVHKASPGQTRSRRAIELVGLPLDEDEEQWFEDVLLRGNASTLPGSKDTVMMRRLATGRLEEITPELESLGGKKIDGLNWDDLRGSIRHM
ncbi:unnamed protein product [Penicillium salamii]|uniref:ELYS-like domain-containing protein n=1 Tax=Penicillium salamii TaxID=1612424 RepID=A0A9W4JA06_9EURO|nr:unnamed protein product [Penicillium salamii]CAG8029851.1 unnamed protein product [Penicillium salamii]CAG8067493.1 unnamed protein product [Penicillium salamii]CAG8074916.1 unnamed protein product [Penicillium salamii]CAG8095270.1 unnamed protein product [Penicillium salamii]